MTITKRNTVNKEILINKKVLLSDEKGLLSIKKGLFTKKKRLAHTEKRFVYIQKTNPQQTATANSHDKKMWQILTADIHVIFLWQKTITNTFKGVPTMLLLTHTIIKIFMFYV